ncbi:MULTISPECIES: hypothetical protein [unclassified Pseudofrankia]|uniref:hypothetical protein n=1 Tax=unclassified Pseudofrankia TaxID=2994372 RepID=UPI0008D8D8FF|nr:MULTISPECIES: hypothetical protein [unclassified Pseudofrankia]MDT3446748.1 hypothetical protein [Pseudofrankia sp. BMG5.37]OHV59188.1 hypothetical protein BCD48_41795 [Pseudofrankia sp. BMG5.36]
MQPFHPRRPRLVAGACAVVLALGLGACSDSGGGSGDAPPTGAAGGVASRYTTPLKGVCPDRVVVQAGWWPEVDDGYLYQLLGADPTIDTGRNRVVGQLGGTGVELEIRAGGPAVGFQPVSSQMAQDDDILAGVLGLDEAVQQSGNQPTVAVFASYEKSPLAFIWGDPAWKFTSVADIGRADVTVLGSAGAAYLDVFKRQGQLSSSRIDTSYQGDPARFVAADGKIVQQAFITNEPYRLEHDVKAWGKPVEYLLLGDEYPVYLPMLTVRADKLAANRDCLGKLVPLFQQAQRDYVTDPGPTNQVLLRTVETLNTSGFALSEGLLADGSAKQKSLGLIANGTDGVLGSFDTARVQKLIGQLVPVFEAQGTKPKPGLAPSDLMTNEFLDTSVSLS